MAKDKKKTGTKVPKAESKVDRFVRVVTPRVSKACKAISVIGYCAGATYEYTPEQIKQIVDTLTNAQNEILAKFAGKKSATEEFAFKQ